MNAARRPKANNDTEKRYLVIGSTGYLGVDSVSWDTKTLPNIVDYDTVVIDVRSLDESILQKISYKRLEEIRIALIRLLHSKGTIIVLTDFRHVDDRPTDYPNRIDNYDWSPIAIGVSKESGESIVVKEERFRSYLTNLKDWPYYLFIPQDALSTELTEYFGSTYNTKYEIQRTPFVINRYGKILAGSFAIEVYAQVTEHSTLGSYKVYPEKPQIVTGEIILLPLLKGIEPKEAVSLVLKDLTGIVPRTEIPDWAENLTVPQTPEIEAQIANKRENIGKLFDEIGALEARRRALEDYKRLLYASGPELEEIVKRCLEEVGGKVTPSRYGQEEYVLEVDGVEYLVEVKGVSKSISLTNLRQLNDYLLKYEEETKKSCKGVLFGNAWRSDPPKKRGTTEMPEFPPNVIERATQWQVALVSSTMFFSAFCAFLRDPTRANPILRAITVANGVVDFSPITNMMGKI
jgi:hypothetical protein